MDVPGHLPLHEIAKIARETSRTELAARYGDAFVVVHASQLSGAALLSDTIVPESTGGVTADVVFHVVPVRKRAEAKNPYPHITVGRAGNNDVVVPDETVSKFHAYFRKDELGRYLLQDAGSRNGTFVSEQPVPARGAGDAVVVETQRMVRFGSIPHTFLLLDELLETVERMARLS